jgi:hypothetical protein
VKIISLYESAAAGDYSIVNLCVPFRRRPLKPLSRFNLRQGLRKDRTRVFAICQLGGIVQVVGALGFVTRAGPTMPPPTPWPGGQDTFYNDARPIRIIPCDAPAIARNDRASVATWTSSGGKTNRSFTECVGTKRTSACLFGSADLALRKWSCCLDPWYFCAAFCSPCQTDGAAPFVFHVAISAGRYKSAWTRLRLCGTRVLVATSRLSKSIATRRPHPNRTAP